MAVYPPSIAVWIEKRDFIDPIFARHFNIAQDEIRATERTVGVNPQVAVADPAARTPDYSTVTNRVQKSARGEPMCSYRGTGTELTVPVNQHFRPPLTSSEDTHSSAISTGYRLPETGYWVINAKADWPSTAATQVHPTTRALAIEINGADLGLRDSILETANNRDDMSTIVTWQERLSKGTDISLVLRGVNADPEQNPMPVNVYLRVYLVRCLEDGNVSGIPNPDFRVEPTPPRPVPELPIPAPGVRPGPDPIEPTPAPPRQSYSLGISYERFDGGFNVFYDDGSFAHVAHPGPVLGTNGPES